MTNSERIHHLADSHAQGTHDSDPQFDCYDCDPWINGYGAQVLASLSANTELTPEWWHSGGGIMGIAIQHDGHFFFIGAADGTEVGMDVEKMDDWEFIESADFGEIQSNTPEVMANKIHDTITNQTWMDRIGESK